MSMRRGLRGPLSAPDMGPHYRHALNMTMLMYKVDPSQSQFVDMNMQNTILNTLHMQCVHVVKPYLQAKSKYYNEEVHAKKWPFWTAQNDSLRKIVYGTYKGKTLPIPLSECNSHDQKRRVQIVLHSANHCLP